MVLKETYSGEDGNFRIEIPWRENVKVVVGKERYESRAFGGENADGTLDLSKPLNVVLTPLEAIVLKQANRTLVKMEEFHFDRNRKTITPEIAAILDTTAIELKKFPEIRLRVEAHTDSRGYARTNQRLSQDRATAIRDYLISKGVDPEVFAEVKGYGETQIINNCTDGVYCLDMLHKQNERYPFVILNFDEL